MLYSSHNLNSNFENFLNLIEIFNSQELSQKATKWFIKYALDGNYEFFYGITIPVIKFYQI